MRVLIYGGSFNPPHRGHEAALRSAVTAIRPDRIMVVPAGMPPHKALAENLKHGEQMAKNPDMEHDDPNAKRLAPKKTGEIVWAFTKAGEFDFSCLIPGHREAGMTGKIIVK